MLGGRRAFRRDTAAETMAAIIRDEPTPLAEIDPGISQSLDRLVTHCVEKDPARRFQSVRDVEYVLGTAAQTPSSASGAAVSARLPRLAAGRLAWALARAPLGVGAPREILEGVVDADWSSDGTKLAVTREVEGEARLEFPLGTVLFRGGGYPSAPRISPDGSRVAFIRHQVKGDGREKDLSFLDGTVATDLSADGSMLLFSETWIGGEPGYSFFLRRSSGDEPVRLDQGWGSDLSADGKRALSYPVEGGEPRPVAGALPTDDPIAWTDEGRSLLVRAPGKTPAEVYRLDPKTGRRERCALTGPIRRPTPRSSGLACSLL